jgi:hypothetical protein
MNDALFLTFLTLILVQSAIGFLNIRLRRGQAAIAAKREELIVSLEAVIVSSRELDEARVNHIEGLTAASAAQEQMIAALKETVSIHERTDTLRVEQIEACERTIRARESMIEIYEGELEKYDPIKWAQKRGDGGTER